MTFEPSHLIEHLGILQWIVSSRSLLRVRARLQREMPSAYRKGFYDVWVKSHVGARRRLAKAPPGSVVPLTVKLSPTMRCNLRCKGCFAAHAPIDADLGLEVVSRLVAEARAMGTPSIGVIGGEPLLVHSLFDVFRANRDMGFYLVTNGTLVTREVCERLKELPNVLTVLSIEGFRATNDALRGKGVYDRILRAMSRLRDARVGFAFSTVVHRANRDEVVSAEFMDHMIAQGCIAGGFLPYVPVGNEPRFDIVCSPDEVKGYYAKLDELGRRRALLVLKEGYSDGTFFNSGCGAAETLHVSAHGVVEPCNGIQFTTANVKTSSLEEIVASPFFQAIRRLHPQRERRCLVITDPEGVLRAVKEHGAVETHEGALASLEAWAKAHHERDDRDPPPPGPTMAVCTEGGRIGLRGRAA